MQVVAAIKIVPDDQDIQVAADRSLDFSKARPVVSEYDLNAQEAAVQLAAATGGSAIAVTAGAASHRRFQDQEERPRPRHGGPVPDGRRRLAPTWTPTPPPRCSPPWWRTWTGGTSSLWATARPTCTPSRPAPSCRAPERPLRRRRHRAGGGRRLTQGAPQDRGRGGGALRAAARRGVGAARGGRASHPRHEGHPGRGQEAQEAVPWPRPRGPPLRSCPARPRFRPSVPWKCTTPPTTAPWRSSPPPSKRRCREGTPV